jgi:plastocyanin
LLAGVVCGGAVIAGSFQCAAQSKPVTVQVQITRPGAQDGAATGKSIDASNVVVWFSPLDTVKAPASQSPSAPRQQLIQRNKAFEPHVLVVQTGSQVEFPNLDPFFHNVFSLFDGKRFDLGLYESGTSKTIRFDHAGVSFLFCNIHSEMSAVVVAVDTPYFGRTDRSGRATIANVPDGRYRVQVWYERSSPDDLKGLEQVISLASASRSIVAIQITDNARFKLDHKNLYGKDYLPPSSAY